MKKNLYYLLLLTAAFFVWQILCFWSYGNLHDSIISVFVFTKGGVALSLSIFIPIIINYCLVFFLYSFWTVAVWGVSELSGKFLKYSERQVWYIGVIIWILSVIWFFAANCVLYPSSVFAKLFAVLLSREVAQIIIYIASGALLFYIGMAIIQLMSFIGRPRRLITCFCKPRKMCLETAIGMFLIIPIGQFVYYANNHATLPANTAVSSPNVIIIGIDDVIPEHIHHLGYAQGNTPYLDELLTQSTVFTSAITPLARTFVAWGSILTGQYPVHHGIRENFQDIKSIDLSNSLVANLQQAGYQAIFATDDPSDASFTSMDKSFGFDRVIAPSPKLSNLLLTYLNDFPITNLLSNTKLGALLFPSNYANRFAKITYEPKRFIEQIHSALAQRQNKPLFLSVHLCLAHWPFVWAGSALSDHKDMVAAYDTAITGVDQQVQSLFKVLQHEKLLEHAIVVVLSDHGEAFGLPQDRMIAKQYYIRGDHSRADLFSVINHDASRNDSIVYPIGHGSDILSYTQQHNLLALRFFGLQKQQPIKIVDNPVSLVDVKYTVLQLLNFSYQTTDGISLLPYVFKNTELLSDRMLFAETAFSPASINTTAIIDVNKVIIEAADYYALDPDGQEIKLKNEVLPKILKQRERAVYYRDWALASIPSKNGAIPILVNRTTHQWTDDLTTAFAQKSPATQMLKALQQLYGDEVR